MSQEKKEEIVTDEEKDKITDQNEKVDTQNQDAANNVEKQEVTVSTVNRDEDEDTTIYNVVVNHEEQYSIWPEDSENPKGWRNAGKTGLKKECLAYIKEVWTDMRPLSLRKKNGGDGKKAT